MHEADRGASAPDARVNVAGLVHRLAARAADEFPEFLELGALGPSLEPDDLARDIVEVDASRIVERAEDVRGLSLYSLGERCEKGSWPRTSSALTISSLTFCCQA
jgi:hypothetical protein